MMKLVPKRSITLVGCVLTSLLLLSCGGPGGDPPKSFQSGMAISAASPSKGPTGGGTSVTISGTGFPSQVQVLFGGVFANTANVVSSGQIVAEAPAHAAGLADIEVRAQRGNDRALLPNGFTYEGFSITSVSPNSGPQSGGTAITINGTAIQPGVTVLVGGTAATSVTFVSSTQVTAVTPPGAAGTADVQLTNTNGEIAVLSGGFNYQASLSVSSVSPSSGPLAGGTLVNITGTGFLSGATVSFGGVAGTSVTLISSTQLQAVTPARAAGSVGVQVTNPGGASVTLSNGFTYVGAPTVASVSPNSGPTTGGTAVTITGTNFQSGISVTFGGTAATSVTFNSSTQIQAVTPARAAGTVTVQVTNTDAQTGSLANAFTFNTTLTLSSLSPVSGSTSGGTTVTISGANIQSGATVTFGGTAATSVTFISSSQLQAVTPARAAGTVSVQVTNPGGQSATLTNAFTFVTGLAITSISPAAGPTTGGTVVTINGSGFQSGATVAFLSPSTPSGVAATGVTFISSSQLQAVTPAFPADVADVRVTNPGGQSATAQSAFTFIVNLSITNITPSSGPTSGGTTVTLDGTGFGAGISVLFGGTAGTSVNVVNANQLTVVTPARAAGAVEVRVVNTNGDFAGVTNGFTYVLPLSVNGVSPASGTPAGGKTVTIDGNGFQPGVTISFGGTPATSVTYASPTGVFAVTPAHAPGSVTVQATNPGGATASKANAYTFNNVLTVTSISPNVSSSNGGETVTVTGTGFQANTTVFFGTDAPATSVTVVSPTQLSVVTPARPAGFVDVSVSTPDTQFVNLPGAFQFTVAKTIITDPQVSSISPNVGSPSGGTNVTITGTNFASGLALTFGGTPALSVSTVSGGQILATTPARAAGVVDVKVTNPDGGTGTLASSFTYEGLDLISLSPAAADIAGGTVITLNGTGFQSGASVVMGGLLAAVTFVSSTQLQAIAPARAAGVVDVTVTNPNAQFKTLAASLTYASPPTISSILPDTGLATGGTTLTIRGVGFQNGVGVKFGGVSAPSVTLVSSTQLTVVTPAHAIGTVNVQVTNPDASTFTRTNGFRFGQIIFQDTFESGSFANFDFVQNATDTTINSNASFVRFGSKSAQIRYQICGDSSNPACGGSHQDTNRWIEKDFPTGLPQHFFVRGYVYFKTPEPGASALSSVQRKIYYIKAASGPAGTPNYLWSVLLTEDTVNGKMGIRILGVPKSGSISYSLYGGDNELGNKSSLINGIFELQFDRWYNIEIEIKSKSAPGASDAILRLWIDGQLIFQKTTWNSPCRPGGSFNCPAFPDDAFLPGSITRVEIGTQADRVNFQAVDEFRFWDNVAVADAFIGP